MKVSIEYISTKRTLLLEELNNESLASNSKIKDFGSKISMLSLLNNALSEKDKLIKIEKILIERNYYLSLNKKTLEIMTEKDKYYSLIKKSLQINTKKEINKMTRELVLFFDFKNNIADLLDDKYTKKKKETEESLQLFLYNIAIKECVKNKKNIKNINNIEDIELNFIKEIIQFNSCNLRQFFGLDLDLYHFADISLNKKQKNDIKLLINYKESEQNRKTELELSSFKNKSKMIKYEEEIFKILKEEKPSLFKF